MIGKTLDFDQCRPHFEGSLSDAGNADDADRRAPVLYVGDVAIAVWRFKGIVTVSLCTSKRHQVLCWTLAIHACGAGAFLPLTSPKEPRISTGTNKTEALLSMFGGCLSTFGGSLFRRKACKPGPRHTFLRTAYSSHFGMYIAYLLEHLGQRLRMQNACCPVLRLLCFAFMLFCMNWICICGHTSCMNKAGNIATVSARILHV